MSNLSKKKNKKKKFTWQLLTIHFGIVLFCAFTQKRTFTQKKIAQLRAFVYLKRLLFGISSVYLIALRCTGHFQWIFSCFFVSRSEITFLMENVFFLLQTGRYTPIVQQRRNPTFTNIAISCKSTVTTQTGRRCNNVSTIFIRCASTWSSR